MNLNLRHLISLTNLKQSKPAGQIATLLILFITTLLIFTLIVVNIGQVSNYATNISNAADAGSLFLASQLGTYAYQISQSLADSCGSPAKCCVEGGFLSVILAIIFAIIAVIIVVVTWGTGYPLLLVAAGALGGAIGGGIGGQIQGTGFLQGALQGALIGASIGAGAGIGVMIGPTTVLGVSISATSISIAAVTLAAASAIYNAYVADQITADAMAEASKALNGLPDKLRMRESVFLQALSSTIDDPTKVIDDVDSDGDGDTTELVPYFQVWWEKRIRAIKAGIASSFPEASRIISNFFNGAVARYQGAIRKFWSSQISTRGIDNYSASEDDAPSQFDGNLIKVFRALENAEYDISFWEHGRYDEVDDSMGLLYDVIEFTTSLQAADPDDLAYAWNIWAPAFYDPNCSGSECADYYTFLEEMIYGNHSVPPPQKGMLEWLRELERIRKRLPECVFGTWNDAYGNPYDWYGNPADCCDGGVDEYGNPVVCYCRQCAEDPCSENCIITQVGAPKPNPPCKGPSDMPNFGSIDECMDDEFQIAKDAVNEFVDESNRFRDASKQFYNDLAAVMNADVDVPEFGGNNPVTYTWADSRGDHSIMALISPFTIPYTRKTKSGNWLKKKICIELVYGTQTVWLQIGRVDPANVNLGILGKWNPSFGGRNTHKSKAYYRGFVGSDSVQLTN